MRICAHEKYSMLTTKLLLNLLIMMSLYAKCSGQDQCSVIMQQNFHECQKKVATSKPETILNFPCKNMSFCARSFRMSYIRLEPYHRMEINVINEMINYCCGNCARLKTERIYKDPSNVALEKLNESNFIFPFLAPVRTKNLYGFHFIPIIDTPKLFYITAKRHSPRETVLKLIIACAELWPLFLICILLAVISGFIVWSVETWKNPNEFSRTFHLGLFDGFWWAFVSMTTVGYGDKSPKSWFSRSFAIMWILIGITVCALFTAALTTAILSAINPPVPGMSGMRVGWLQHRLYEATVIAQYRGNLITYKDPNYLTGITRLFEMMAKEEIEGFVLDEYILNQFETKVTDEESIFYDKEIVTQLNTKSIRTEIDSKDEQLSYGVLVRDYEDYHYFRSYIIDNAFQRKLCNLLKINAGKEPSGPKVKLFSVEAGLFWPSFASTLGILAVICCFGFVYEIYRGSTDEGKAKCVIKRDRSAYKHTMYQQNWINLFSESSQVVNDQKVYQQNWINIFDENKNIVNEQKVYEENWIEIFPKGNQLLNDQQNWVNLFPEGSQIVNDRHELRKQEEDITRKQIREELDRQDISVLYLENCDVLIFRK